MGVSTTVNVPVVNCAVDTHSLSIGAGLFCPAGFENSKDPVNTTKGGGGHGCQRGHTAQRSPPSKWGFSQWDGITSVEPRKTSKISTAASGAFHLNFTLAGYFILELRMENKALLCSVSR